MVLLQEGRIHGKLGKQVLELVFQEGKSPAEILRERNWEQITDPAVIGPLVEKILAKNPHVVETIRRGDMKPWGFLVGQIMKETGGRADPRVVQTILKERLQVSFLYLLSFGGAISAKETRMEWWYLEAVEPFRRSLRRILPGKKGSDRGTTG